MPSCVLRPPRLCTSSQSLFDVITCSHFCFCTSLLLMYPAEQCKSASLPAAAALWSYGRCHMSYQQPSWSACVQGETAAGIDVRKGAVSNMLDGKVVQPLLVSTSALTLATECVRMILKVRLAAHVCNSGALNAGCE